MAKDNEEPKGFFGSLWKTVSGFFEAQSTTIWMGFEGIIPKIVLKLFPSIEEFWEKRSLQTWDEMLSVFEETKWIDAESKQQLMELSKLPRGGSLVSYFGVFLMLCLNQVTTWSDVIASDIKRNLNVQHRPVDASASELIHSVFLNPEKDAEVRHILAQLGLPDNQIELLFLAFHRAYDEGTIRNLYFRGVITQPQVYERMKSIGFNEQRTTEIIQGWPVIPSLGDIVRYIAKEAFEPKMIELFGLLEDYPVEAEEWAAKQGLEKRWVEAEWVAHWRDLGIDFMLEAYHRKIVEWPLVERYMALIEIPPKLREIVKDTAFRVFTRVDVRRMHYMKVLTDDELITAYEDQGYDEPKAIKMAEFTIKYNKDREKDLTKSEIIKGYAERIIPQLDAKEMLVDMDYSIDEAEYLLAYEDYKFDKKLQDKRIKNIQFRFVNNFINEADANSELTQMALRGEHIKALIDEWKIDIIQDMKFPSKTDLDKFIKAKIISQDIYIREMIKLGYNDEYISWYWQLMSKK